MAIDYRLANEVLNRKADYSLGDKVVEGGKIIREGFDRSRELDRRVLQDRLDQEQRVLNDQNRQKMQTFGDFVSGQYASGNPNRDLIISEYAKVNPGGALDAAGFGNNFGRKSIESTELRGKQKAHAIEAGRIRKLAEQYSLEYDTASKEKNSEGMEKARRNYISNYNTYIQEIEPLFAPLKFTSYQQKPYTIKPFSRRLEDDEMRAIKQQTAQAKQTTAEAAAANVGLDKQKLQADLASKNVDLKSKKLELRKEQKIEKEGTDKQKKIAGFVKLLISLDKIINDTTNKPGAWTEIGTNKLIGGRFDTASKAFSEKILRDKSGAAIGIKEQANDITIYIPTSLDFFLKSKDTSTNILQDKANYRASMINVLIAEAGNSWKKGDYTAPRIDLKAKKTKKAEKKALFQDANNSGKESSDKSRLQRLMEKRKGRK